MSVYPIYHFLVESDIDLPCDPSGSLSMEQETPIRATYSSRPLDQYETVHWIARKYGNYARSYAVNDGVLACIGDHIRFHVNGAAEEVRIYYPEVNYLTACTLDQAIELDAVKSQAAAIVVNLGLSICSLLGARLPLHGAGVLMDSKMIAIMAPLGTGKTTLLWELINNGATFATDDIFTIRSSGAGVVMSPSRCLNAKISQQLAERMGLDYTIRREMVPGCGEFWISIPVEQRITCERSPDALFVLQPSTDADANEITVYRAKNGAAIELLMANTQGLWACFSVLDVKSIFRLYETIAMTTPIYVLRYLRRIDILPQLVDTIRKAAKQL